MLPAVDTYTQHTIARAQASGVSLNADKAGATPAFDDEVGKKDENFDMDAFVADLSVDEAAHLAGLERAVRLAFLSEDLRRYALERAIDAYRETTETEA